MSIPGSVDAAALNCVNGEWRRSSTSEYVEVFNPATSEVLATVLLAGPDEVAAAASAAFPSWRRTPPQDRIGHLLAFRRAARIDPISALKCE